MELYRHTQIGHVIRVSLGIALTVAAGIFAQAVYLNHFPGMAIAGAVVLVLALSLVLFSSLTVVVNDSALQLRFGPGLIKTSFALNEVASCKTVRNPWWYGWGIHLTPAGWLYNVSGFEAVELTMTNGRRYRIGTDTPRELEEIIRRHTRTA